MGLGSKLKEKVKKEIHYQKLGYREAGRRIKKKVKQSIEEAKENQRKRREFEAKLRAAEEEGMQEEMLKAAKDIGREKARAKAKAILGNDQGFTVRMPDLWGFQDGKTKQKKNNHQ